MPFDKIIIMDRVPVYKKTNQIPDTCREDARNQGLRILAVIIAREYLAKMRAKTKEASGTSG
jgi:predicted transcriptional regulator